MYSPKNTYTLVDYTGGSTAYFHGKLELTRRQGEKVVMCFTQLIRHGGEPLHLAPPLPQRPPYSPMGLNLGTYNIQDGCGFVLPQAISAVKRGNYDLILLTETKISDTIYCPNCMGYGVVCPEAKFTMAGGAQGGGRNSVVGEAGGLYC